MLGLSYGVEYPHIGEHVVRNLSGAAAIPADRFVALPVILPPAQAFELVRVTVEQWQMSSVT